MDKKDIESRRYEHIYYYSKEEKYRHFYSDIYAALSVIDKDPSVGNLEILSQNLEIIMNNYMPNVNVDEDGNTIDISDEIFKLYDHANLDIARFMALKETGDKNNAEQRRMNGLVSDIEQKYKKLEDTIPDIRGLQKDYISILGIFASIVLSFTAGLAFSTSVFENIYKSSIYRTIIIAALVGMIFIAMIWLLMDFVRSVHGHIKRNYWYIIIPESVLAIIIIVTALTYKVDWFYGEEQVTRSIYEDNIELEMDE